MNASLNHRSAWRLQGGVNERRRTSGAGTRQGAIRPDDRRVSMTKRLGLAKAGFAAAAAAMILAGGIAAPAFAQSAPNYGPNGTYYDPCQRDKTQRQVAGGILGAIGGAVLGSNLAHGGGRDGGALIGGALGAAGGAAVGGATAACDSAPPPPPPAYAAAYPPPPPPPVDERRYDDGRYADRGGDCAMVEGRVYFPDGTIEHDQVHACRGDDGHWFVDE
jgi:hypothetical protein